MEHLLSGALNVRCEAALIAALAIWDEMNPKTRTRIEKQAAFRTSPEVRAREHTTEDLERIVAELSGECASPRALRRHKRLQKTVLPAYQDELARRKAKALPVERLMECFKPKLTDGEREKLEQIKERIQRGNLER